MKKKKLPSIPLLKRKLDKAFSEFIRRRDEPNGCITCGVRKPWKEMHCGHWLSRSYTAIRWNEANCWGQCPQCNVFCHGKPDEFWLAMEKKIGRGTMDILLALRLKPYKLMRSDLLELIEIYTQKIKALP